MAQSADASKNNRRFRSIFASGSHGSPAVSPGASAASGGLPGKKKSVHMPSHSISYALAEEDLPAELDMSLADTDFVDMFSLLASDAQLLHQQAEEGLLALERVANYVKRIADARLQASNANLKACQEEESRGELQDRMPSCLSAYKQLHATFREWAEEEQQYCEGLLRYVVQPLLDFHQQATARRLRLEANRQRQLDELKQLRLKLDTIRQGCFKQWESLSEIGTKVHESLEPRDSRRWVSLRKKFEKQLQKTRQVFKAFELEVEDANLLQDQYYFEWLPEHCRALERLEVLRINQLHEAIDHVGQLTTALVTPLPGLVNPLIKAAKKVSAPKDVEQMIRAALKGQRPLSHGFLTKLPCDSDVLQPSPEHELPPLVMPLLSENVDELSMRRCMAQQLQRDRQLSVAANRLQSARESRFSARSVEQNRLDEAEAAALVLVEDVEKMVILDLVQVERAFPMRLDPAVPNPPIPPEAILPMIPEGTILRMTSDSVDAEWETESGAQLEREISGYILSPLLGHTAQERIHILFPRGCVRAVYLAGRDIARVTLEHILATPSLTACLRAYTAKEFSQENVDFWLAVCDFRRQCGSAAADFLVPEDGAAPGSPGEYHLILGDEDPWGNRSRRPRPVDTIIRSPPVAVAVAPADDDDEDEDADEVDSLAGGSLRSGSSPQVSPPTSTRSHVVPFTFGEADSAVGSNSGGNGGNGGNGGGFGSPQPPSRSLSGASPAAGVPLGLAPKARAASPQSLMNPSNKSSSGAQVLLAEAIVNRFILPTSPQQVNLPSHSRRRIMEMHRQGLFTVHMFDQAQLDVFHMLRNDSMARFLRSAFFHGWLKRFYSLLPPHHAYVVQRDRSQFADVVSHHSGHPGSKDPPSTSGGSGLGSPPSPLSQPTTLLIGEGLGLTRNFSSHTVGRASPAGANPLHSPHGSSSSHMLPPQHPISASPTGLDLSHQSSNDPRGGPAAASSGISPAVAAQLAASAAAAPQSARGHNRRKSFSFSPTLLLRRRRTQTLLASPHDAMALSPSPSSVSLPAAAHASTTGTGSHQLPGEAPVLSPSVSMSSSSTISATPAVGAAPAAVVRHAPPPGAVPARLRNHYRSLSFSQQNSHDSLASLLAPQLLGSGGGIAGGPGGEFPVSKSGSVLLQRSNPPVPEEDSEVSGHTTPARSRALTVQIPKSHSDELPQQPAPLFIPQSPMRVSLVSLPELPIQTGEM